MVASAAGKVVDAMKGTPAVLALLVVICAALIFSAYLLGVVASAAGERNKTQYELIEKLVRDIRDCRQNTKSGAFQYFDRAEFDASEVDRLAGK